MITSLFTESIIDEYAESNSQVRLIISLQHEPEGTRTDLESIVDQIRNNKSIKYIVFTGDDPFDQAEACVRLAITIKHENPELDIWIYSHYKYEDLLSNDNYLIKVLIDLSDVIVDGVTDETSDKLAKSRCIDTKESIEQNKVIQYTRSADDET